MSDKQIKMAEKKYNFYSYLDYMHDPDFVNMFRGHYKFIKKLSNTKFTDKGNVESKELLKLIATILCLFQYIPNNSIDETFNKDFGHNYLQKARLGAYLSDIDINSTSYEIKQSDFIINILYLLFCDRENLSNYKATIYLPKDKTYCVERFDYFTHKKKLYSYVDITPRKTMIKLNALGVNDKKTTINWINLFYIWTPDSTLKYLTVESHENYRGFMDWLATGEIATKYQKLIDINTKKIESLFESPKKKEEQIEQAKITTNEKSSIKMKQVEEKEQAKTISLDDYINQNLELINQKGSVILSTYEGFDENKTTEQFHHKIFLEEKLCEGFKDTAFEKPFEYKGKRLYEIEKDYWLNEAYQNDELLQFLQDKGEDDD